MCEAVRLRVVHPLYGECLHNVVMLRSNRISIGGELTSYSFDLAAQRFEMCILTNPVLDHRDHPTEIFLPVRHFKNPDIRVTDGRTEYHEAGQILLWWPSLNSAPRRMHLVVNGR